jgi:aspartate 1-decarboxylase
MRWVLRSKIQGATITESEVDYEGSITIDKDLVDKAGLVLGERVLVVSKTSGARLETYIMGGTRGSGVVCMNGAAAHAIKKGERITIMGFELADGQIDARKVLVDDKNFFVRYL